MRRWMTAGILILGSILAAPAAMAQQWGSWSAGSGNGWAATAPSWSTATSTGGWTTVVIPATTGMSGSSQTTPTLPPAGSNGSTTTVVLPAGNSGSTAPVVSPAPTLAPANPAPTTSSNPSQELLADTNQARAAAGLPALAEDPALSAIALQKAQDMVNNGYFGHVSPSFGLTLNLVQAAGISFSAWGENIAEAPTVAEGFSALMGSAGHRANILSSAYDRIGVAAVAGPNGEMFLVQEFLGG